MGPVNTGPFLVVAPQGFGWAIDYFKNVLKKIVKSIDSAINIQYIIVNKGKEEQTTMPTVNLDFIKTRRNELGLTQEQMAESLNIPRTFYNRREIGRTNFKAVEMPILAARLMVTIEQLYNMD